MANRKITPTWIKVVCIVLSVLMVGSIAYFTIATIIQTMSAKSTAVEPVAPAIVENAEYDVPDFYTAV